MKKIHVAVATALAFASAQAAQKEAASTLADQQSVAVTIYNENLALIKDTRRVALDAGINRLALREVSARMRPETASLRSLTHPGALSLLEQNFDFDLLTPAKLLEKYVGREVKVFRVNQKTGIESFETATVLAANGGVVLRIGDRIETGLPGRIVYDGVPPNLRDRPTLVTELQSSRAGQQTVELSYLSGGLAWKADYVAELNAADSSLDLNGWVTLTNTSGTSYPNARLQLVAGDVNRVRDEMRYAAKAMSAVRAEAPAPRQMSEESLFEYHLYTLQRPTTIADNQTKQVALLGASAVPVKKELVLQGNDYYYRSSVGGIGQKMKVGVFVQFDNREATHLGLPMPKGVVRVYKKDSAGNAQFIGEDSIDHTPKNESVRLKLGEAFDVTANKKQSDFKRREPFAAWTYVYESAYEIVLKNAKKEAQTVVVREPVPGDWRMLEESAHHAKVAAGTAEWKIDVPAEGSATLKYRVLVRY
ncbi:MAG TPA: DUF4139 domain-containing protein [Burkholderiales bacterium]|jgi:hypothetical protein